MIQIVLQLKVLVACEPVDFRKGSVRFLACAFYLFIRAPQT